MNKDLEWLSRTSWEGNIKQNPNLTSESSLFYFISLLLIMAARIMYLFWFTKSP